MTTHLKRIKKGSVLAFFVFSLYSISYGQVYNPINYNYNGTPTYGIKIKTNLPFSNWSQMPTLIIEGLNYGQSLPTGLMLTWYIYDGKFWSSKISSFGADNPKIKLSNEDGKVVVFINERNYFQRFSIRAFAQGMSEQSDWFANWQTVDEPLSGSNTVEVPYENSFKGTVNFSNGIWTTDGKVGIGTTSPQTLLNVNVGTGGSNGLAGVRIGGLGNYESLELGIDGDYDGMIRCYGNNLNYYAGHWKVKGVTATENHSHNWYTSKAGSTNWSVIKMTLNQDGNLGIGTTNPAYKLDVLGTIRAKEVLVNLDGGADFVFEKDYKLLPIEHVANYVQENKHLPDIPSANDMVKNGVSMGDMQVKLLQKVEELTLYVIELKKEINKLKQGDK